MESYLNTERAPKERYSFTPQCDSTDNGSIQQRKFRVLKSSCPESWMDANKSYDYERRSASDEQSRLSRLKESRGVKGCLKFENIDQIINETSRKPSKIKMILPEPQQQINFGQHRRGYKHIIEVGNFSNYNALLKSNQNAMLDR